MPKITTGGVSYEPGREPEGAAAETGPPQPPPVSAPKADHVDYAVKALGVPPDEAESMTKADLTGLAQTAASGEAAPADPAPRPAPRPAP